MKAKVFKCELCQVEMELEKEFEPTTKRRYYMRRYKCPLCGNTELKINSEMFNTVNNQKAYDAYMNTVHLKEEESFE